jgi:hypothetical protein
MDENDDLNESKVEVKLAGTSKNLFPRNPSGTTLVKFE